MKIDWNKKYTTIAIYALIVICLSISFYLSVTKFSKLSELTNAFFTILKPFLLGFALAYVLNFILDLFENNIVPNIFKNVRGKSKRAVSIILTYISVILTIILFSKFVLPQVVDSISRLIKDFPEIVNQLYKYIDTIIGHLNLNKEVSQIINTKITELGKQVIDFATNFVPHLANMLFNIILGVWNMILGIIISIYILADKENFFAMTRKFISATFSAEITDRLLYITRLSNHIFGKFLIGKIIDSCIIAVITFIILSFANMPYKTLLTFIIGTTNIIPFFGPFIGAIPSVILVLLVDPLKALWLVIIIFGIQQLDGNIIGPKILGDSIGISSFWILFSLLLAGKFFGILGMIVGVPVFAIVYTLVGDMVNSRLTKKGLPIDKEKYMKK